MNLIQRIRATAEVIGHRLSDMGAGLLAAELEDYPVADVGEALGRCMREGVRALTLSAILTRMPGAHVTAEEAWAIASKAYSEEATVVWTDAIAEAFGSVRHMRDRVAARMAFRSSYDRMVALRPERPRWWATVGTDPGQRNVAIESAVESGRLTGGDATRYLPGDQTLALPREASSSEGPVTVGEMHGFLDAIRRSGGEV